MLTPAPRAVAAPVKNAVRGRWVAKATAKMGARVDSAPSIGPLRAGCTRVSRNEAVRMGWGEISAGAMALLVLKPFIAIHAMLPAGRSAVVVRGKRLAAGQRGCTGSCGYFAGGSRGCVHPPAPGGAASAGLG